MSAEAFYRQCLQQIERKMGNKGTGESEIEQMSDFFLRNPTRWKGVFALNEPWRKTGGYRVVNLEPRGNRGEHWVGVANNLIYDSFGRNRVVEIREHKLGIRPFGEYSYTAPDAEQLKQEDNCGQRCIAWLMVYDKYGETAARSI